MTKKNNPYLWLAKVRESKIVQFNFKIDVPSANHIWKKNRNGFIYLTDEARDFKLTVKGLLGHDCLPFDPISRLGIEYTFWVPNIGLRDLANYEKVMTDAISATTDDLKYQVSTGYLIANDRQIDYVSMERRLEKDCEPMVRLLLGPVEAFQ